MEMEGLFNLTLGLMFWGYDDYINNDSDDLRQSALSFCCLNIYDRLIIVIW